MSLPVSQYEALLAQVRGLRRQAQHVQQLVDPLLFGDASVPQDQHVKLDQIDPTMDIPDRNSFLVDACDNDSANAHSTHHSVSSEPVGPKSKVSSLYHGTWPMEGSMWNSEPSTLGIKQDPVVQRQMEVPSVMSFASSSGAPMDRLLITPEKSLRSSQQLEAKVDMVYSLLAMLGGQEHADMGETLFALSTNPESCLAMRESGCIPLLVQLVQSDKDSETRKKATKALQNLVQSQPDEKLRKREIRILKLLETVCAYNEALVNDVEFVCENISEDGDKHPVQTVAHLMKLSFDEGHRQAICQLGGIHTIAKLVEIEHSTHGSTSDDTHCIMMRRYACMALTNLTFGDSGNKVLLCSYKDFMKALVVQLKNSCDELRQVTASVLRNLSWRADSSSKEILREIGSVRALMKAAMVDNKENTLKSMLSALWNLSAHCTENKSDICAVKGALEFLIQMLLYKSAPKSLAIIENAGGILRNISSQIAVRDDYREILREHNCLPILLAQLKSPSLTIVSNACGTLWNLSAKNPTDQELLWQLGAPTMLKSLNHSKHKMIAMGSSAALKNLLTAKPGYSVVQQMDSTALSLDLPELPTLGVRKQKALLKGLDQSLTETFDNLDTPSDRKKGKNEQNQRDIPLLIKSPVDEPVHPHTTINIKEFGVNQEKLSKIPQSSGSSSLPYGISDMGNPSTSSPIKPKISHDVEIEIQSDTPEHEIPRKKSFLLRKSNDSTHLHKYSKLKSKNTANEFENSSNKSTEFCLKYSEVENHSNGSENVCVVSDNTSEGCLFSMKKEETDHIDNDKHKLRKRNKEIIANMDEKDHCSTEDISDSEVQPGISRTNIEFISLQSKEAYNEDHNYGNCLNSLPFSCNAACSRSPDTKVAISPIPTDKAQPSPKPRKFGSLEKPQPVPRSAPIMRKESIHEPNMEVVSPAISTDIKNIPNILYQEESIEDNINFQEDLCEKQDVGREKNTNSDLFETREVSGIETPPSNSNTEQKRIPRSSGIPMSKLPSRISSSKSSEPSSKTIIYNSIKASSYEDELSNVDELDKPVSSKQISDARYLKTAEPNEPVRSEQESNMRSEGMAETTEVLNKDLNGKYDDVLFERRKICSGGPVADDCYVTASTGAEIFINQSERCTSQNSKVSNTCEKAVHFSKKPSISNESEKSNLGDYESFATFNDAQEMLLRNWSDETIVDDNISTNVKRSESYKSLEILDNTSQLLFSPRSNCMVFNDKKEERLDMSCNDSANVDTRMLDPDAMIESLDRFTAELVSQASSHLQNKDSLYKSSNNENTWDESSSPNEDTFPSISVSAPNVVSFDSDTGNKSSSNKCDKGGVSGIEQFKTVSNDYSSLNTTTMTDSTLIAMEATKIIEIFKDDTIMSMSANSLISLELDHVQPPSYLNSLSNSITGFLDSKPNSPKLTRKKSLPSNIMVKRALNYPLSHNSSFDSLDQQTTFKGGMSSYSHRSIQNLSHDIPDAKKSFIVNGPINVNYSNQSSLSKIPCGVFDLEDSSQLGSVTDLENINPPSMLNEVTDLCNSLADVATTSIGTDTEIFEDCFTHLTDDFAQTQNDITEFSYANSITPNQSSTSSSENTPKRQKSVGKSLTSKQKRALAKERYKTYIIAAEMVMKDSIIIQEENFNGIAIDNDSNKHPISNDVSPTHLKDSALGNAGAVNIDTKCSKLSPKERRLSERSRFQTQVLEVSQIPNFSNLNLQAKECESVISKDSSNAGSKLSIRKNILQKRLTNKERFKTQTLESSQIASLSLCEKLIVNDTDMHAMVENEAKKVLRTLRDTNTNVDEILDCETISLVSNDDESDLNSGCSVNYRTYHKSWGFRNNIPIISSEESQNDENCGVYNSLDDHSNTSDNEVNRVPPKPKIVKPDEKKVQEFEDDVEQPKGIRGRRKALYSKGNLNKASPKSIKPVKNLTSNLVKNVTSALKTTTPKPITLKPSKIATRPPLKGKTINARSRPISTDCVSECPSTSSVIQKDSKHVIPRPGTEGKKFTPQPLERQGTFTKDDLPVCVNQTKGKDDTTRIPIPGSIKSSIPKVPTKQSNIPRPGMFKSTSSNRNSKPSNIRIYNRSTSADSRETSFSRNIQSSLSSHSLKSEPEKVQQQNGAIKKTMQYQRSNSNTSLNGQNVSKKQVTSKIASIWKKIEESKKKTVIKKDSKKWIEGEVEPLCDGISPNVVSSKNESDDYAPKRVSRLGSFISVDENEADWEVQEVN